MNTNQITLDANDFIVSTDRVTLDSNNLYISTNDINLLGDTVQINRKATLDILKKTSFSKS